MDEASLGGRRQGSAGSAVDQAWLERLCRRTDEILWQSHRFALGHAGAGWPQVVFPAKGKERRVGAQEARLAFVTALLADENAAEWAFAAECPTRLSYRFAHRGVGEKSQRALTDLALFHRDLASPADRCAAGMPADRATTTVADRCDIATLGVEFKFGGRSGKSEKDESIVKDVAKIVAEQPDALWFHTVRGANSATLHGLLNALKAALKTMSNPVRLADHLAIGKAATAVPKTITFHICVLNPDMMVSIHRTLDYRPKKVPGDFFAVDLEAQATGASLEIVDARGWSVYPEPAGMTSPQPDVETLDA